MTRLEPAAFFDLQDWAHHELFLVGEGVWTALGDRLRAYLEAWAEWNVASPVPAGVHLIGDRISIAAGCRLEPGAVIVGPAILEAGVVVRAGAYIREHVLLGAGSLVGAHSEVKGSVLLPRAKAPHQAYVGDSILGRDVNLGAGTICSNVKNVPGDVTLRVGGEVVHTGLRKLGAVLGDACKTGCNTVLNPGVLMGPGSVTYPNATLRSGYYPPRTLVKVRQQQQLLELDRIL
jgi:NDP-sugar pyrophosphorylase family protein